MGYITYKNVDYNDVTVIELHSHDNEVAKAFVRLQEFYESPYKPFKGRYFALQKYMDRYHKDFPAKEGEFRYYNDWKGFNVPGKVVLEFFRLFEGKLLGQECIIHAACRDYIGDSCPDFYLVGITHCHSEDSIEIYQHEVCHALYNGDPEFRSMADAALDNMDSNLKKHMIKTLLDEGYDSKVIYDELNAYMSTATESMFKSLFDIDQPVKEQEVFVENFKDVYAQG